MHEISLVQGLFDQLEDLARQHKMTKVVKITMDIGPLSGVVVDSFRFGFMVLARENRLDEKEQTMCDTCGCASPNEHHDHSKKIDVRESLFSANEAIAKTNKTHFETMGAVAINLISSPGSGKTTLLEHTIDALAGEYRIGVIEGDIETERDADRIRAKGIPVVQLTTGGACHLDAAMTHRGIHRLQDEFSCDSLDLLFIENVGNLVCPTSFDLGEHHRVVLVSVPEGPDKPSKYP
ncbi:unnamed protein product, partial [Cyprideis torosa]